MRRRVIFGVKIFLLSSCFWKKRRNYWFHFIFLCDLAKKTT